MLLTLVLLLVSLGTISAAEISSDTDHNSDNVVQKKVTANKIVKETTIKSTPKTAKLANNKTIQKNNKIKDKNKTVKTAGTTRKVTSELYSQYFTKKSNMTVTTDLVQSGDTLNLQGTFNNVDFSLDKSITLTSQDKNAKLYNCTVYVQGTNSAGSKISNLTIQNTKEYTSGIHVNNSKNLIIENNNIKVTGSYSFAFAADNMNQSTVRLNTLETAMGEGATRSHSAFVMGSSHNNKIANNTVKSNQANTIYLSSYGSGLFKGGICNNNNITGNKVTGYDSSWCNTIQVMGAGNIISYNTVSGGYKGISTQDGTKNTISNNDVSATSTGIYACEGAKVNNNKVHVNNVATAINIGGNDVQVLNNEITSENGAGIDIGGSNILIQSNTINVGNSNGIYAKGDYTKITINNNTIISNKEGILFKKQSSTKKINDVTVKLNKVTSQADYAINFNETGSSVASETKIIVDDSNVLSSKRGTGLEKAYLKPANSNGANTPDSNAKITVTSANVLTYFDTDGNAKTSGDNQILQNTTVYLKGTFNNINFKFPRKVHIIGQSCVINQGTITLMDEAHASTIKDLTIKNNNKDNDNQHAIEIMDVNNCKITNVKITNYAKEESLGIFLCGANGNTISGCTITTSGDLINNGIFAYSSDTNTLESNTININQSNKPNQYDEELQFSEPVDFLKEVLHNHGIMLVYSSNNAINKNTVKVTSQFNKYTSPSSTCKNSVVGIDIYFDSHNNKVTSNNINLVSYGPYVYGMGVLGGNWGSSITTSNATANTFKSNRVSVTGGYFTAGFIAGRNSVNTIVESNTITVTGNKNSTNKGDYVHGVILENSTSSTISKNKITATGSGIYAIELFDSSKNQILSNKITATGTNPYGIAGYRSSNNNIKENQFTLRKVNYGSSTSAKHSDVIPVGDQGIMLMYSSSSNTITQNKIDTNATTTVKLADQSSNNVVKNNSLKAKSKYADKSVVSGHSSNKISNNFLHFVNFTVKPVSAYLGKKVTITATVKSTTSDLKNLTATFKLGSNVIGKSKVSKGKATLSYKVSTLLKATTYQLSVSVVGTNFQNATAITQATFKKAPAKTKVKVAKVLNTAGSKVKLTANITRANGGKIGSGKAEFYLSNKKLATVKVKLGVASYTYKIPAKTTSKVYPIKVVYLGTNDFASSSGSNKLGVQTKSAVSIKKHVATLGKPVVIKAKITANKKAIKSGKVAIKINNKKIANAKISKGVIKYKYTVPKTFDKGNYKLQIVYDGNDTITKVTKSTTIKIKPFKPVFHYKNVKAKVGKKVSLVLKIDNGLSGKKKQTADNGKVSLKLNGKVLKDSKGKVISGTLKKGKIVFKFVALKQLKGYQKITFVYKGNSKFSSLTKTYKKGLLIK